MGVHWRRTITGVIYVDSEAGGLHAGNRVHPLGPCLAIPLHWHIEAHPLPSGLGLLFDGLVEDVKGITWYCGFLLLKSADIFFLASSSDSKHSMSNVSDSKLRLKPDAGMQCPIHAVRSLSQHQVMSRYVFAHPVVHLCSLTRYSHVRF
jgi:hypothetical protein